MNKPREVVAALLQSWQGDDAGVFGMADQILNKLRAEGYVVIDPDFFTCPVCGEEVAPFCIMHGFDGAGVGAYVKEALTEPYGNRGAADEIRAAVGEVPEAILRRLIKERNEVEYVLGDGWALRNELWSYVPESDAEVEFLRSVLAEAGGAQLTPPTPTCTCDNPTTWAGLFCPVHTDGPDEALSLPNWPEVTS